MEPSLQPKRDAVAALGLEEIKCVIVLDEDLPVGLLANTAAVLSLSLGHFFPLIGKDLPDSAGSVHAGLTSVPVPILKASAEDLAPLRKEAGDLADVAVIDVTDAAQTTKNYEDYENKLLETNADELRYLGIALYGKKKAVNKLTGRMGLLR